MHLQIAQVVITIVVVCLFLWRMSYGAQNGLFAEAAGLISVMAAFVAVYYITKIAGDIINQNLGAVVSKIGYLTIAFVVYVVMASLGRALRRVKEIPILGGLDRLFGAILGAVEAALIIYVVEFITEFKIFEPAKASFLQAFFYIQKFFINI